MIEFNGYITGSAEKRYLKRSRIYFANIFMLAILFLLPGSIWFAIIYSLYLPLQILCFAPLIILLVALIPRSKKEKKALTPKRIFTEYEYIVCVTDRDVVSKRIDAVKLVRDFDEFYELVFPIGNLSERFICQKSLLTQGTIEEFEALFEGKIRRLHNTRPNSLR